MFSTRALADFGKGMVKLAVVGVVVGLIVWPDRNDVLVIPTMPVGDMLALVQVEAIKVIIGVLSVMTLITLADVVYQRFMHHKELRMTKQHVKNEHRSEEHTSKLQSLMRTSYAIFYFKKKRKSRAT